MHTILLVLAILFVLGCFGGYVPATWNYYGSNVGLSPILGIVAVILIFLYVTGQS